MNAIRLFVVVLALLVSGCSAESLAIRYSKGYPPAPYGPPDDVTYYNDSYQQSVTYTYKCVGNGMTESEVSPKVAEVLHRFVIVTYTLNTMRMASGWDTQNYTSNGMCGQ